MGLEVEVEIGSLREGMCSGALGWGKLMCACLLRLNRSSASLRRRLRLLGPRPPRRREIRQNPRSPRRSPPHRVLRRFLRCSHRQHLH